MVVLVRVARVVLLLVLVAVAVSLVLAMAGPAGPVQKDVLAGLFVLWVAMVLGFTSPASHLQKGVVSSLNLGSWNNRSGLARCRKWVVSTTGNRRQS